MGNLFCNRLTQLEDKISPICTQVVSDNIRAGVNSKTSIFLNRDKKIFAIGVLIVRRDQLSG